MHIYFDMEQYYGADTSLGISGFLCSNIHNWIKELKELLVSLKKNDADIVVIAIARKMPRLLESFFANEVLSQEFLKNFDSKTGCQFPTSIFDIKGVDIITEHAIPFYFATDRAKCKEVIVLDDFMVYGDSVEQVSECVYYVTGKYPTVFVLGYKLDSNDYKDPPVVACAKTTPYKHPIRLEMASAFTTDNASRILRLNKPIDLEYTILSVKAAQNNENGFIGKKILDSWENFKIEIEKEFKSPNYTSYTICHSISDVYNHNKKIMHICQIQQICAV